MIQRKIGRLDDEDRRLLTCASVQGNEFDTAVVATTRQMDPIEVEERLDCLERVHCFVRRMRETTLPDGTPSLRYQFVHALYQNALYDSLLPSRRASLSKGLAQALIRFHGDKSAAIASDLALLYEAARKPALAIGYYLLAARHAAQVSANQEAMNLARPHPCRAPARHPGSLSGGSAFARHSCGKRGIAERLYRSRSRESVQPSLRLVSRF